MKHLFRTRCSGFSLIEVVIAIGIVSFSILAVVGLLPVGLKTVKNANEQAGAANVLNAIAGAIRSATPTSSPVPGSPTKYNWDFAGISYNFTVGSSANNQPIIIPNLTMEGGNVLTGSDPARLSACVILTPPSMVSGTSPMVTAANSPGTVLISVAWSANPKLIPTTSLVNGVTTITWSGSDGSITTGIQFLPK